MEIETDPILDMIEEGVIVVDTQQKILMYNRSARIFFGLENTSSIHHPAGQIEPGDWVLLGDNCMGMDDGELTTKDLQQLGINEELTQGERIAVISRYKSPNTVPVFARAPRRIKRRSPYTSNAF